MDNVGIVVPYVKNVKKNAISVSNVIQKNLTSYKAIHVF